MAWVPSFWAHTHTPTHTTWPAHAHRNPIDFVVVIYHWLQQTICPYTFRMACVNRIANSNRRTEINKLTREQEIKTVSDRMEITSMGCSFQSSSHAPMVIRKCCRWLNEATTKAIDGIFARHKCIKQMFVAINGFVWLNVFVVAVFAPVSGR